MDFAQIRQEEKRVAAVLRNRDAILDAMHLCDETIADFQREIGKLRNSLRLFENDLRLKSVIPFASKAETKESINQLQGDITRLQQKIDQEHDKLTMYEGQLLEYGLVDDYIVALWLQKEAYIAQFEPAKSIFSQVAKQLETYEEQRPLLQELLKRVVDLDEFLNTNRYILFQPAGSSSWQQDQSPYWGDDFSLGMVEQDRARRLVRVLNQAYVKYIYQHAYLSGLMIGYPVNRVAKALDKPDHARLLSHTYLDMVNRQRQFLQRQYDALLQNITIEKQQRNTFIYSEWKRICEEKEPSLDPKELISQLKTN